MAIRSCTGSRLVPAPVMPGAEKNHRPRFTRLTLGGILIAVTVLLRPAQAADVSQWSVHELSLTASRDTTNPYLEVEVTARLTAPDGSSKTVRGFWDGGREFKLRVTPTMPGPWQYAITSEPADAGLTRNGTFVAAAAIPGRHGFVRRDAQYPTTFSFDDGTRYYMLGTTRSISKPGPTGTLPRSRGRRTPSCNWASATPAGRSGSATNGRRRPMARGASRAATNGATGRSSATGPARIRS